MPNAPVVFNSYLNGPSGGLAYHWAAFRYRRTLWAPFRNQVREWLMEVWHPTAPELIIFGPSAGWTLPGEFLERFEKIVAVEPDALARWMFARRFPQLRGKIEWVADTQILPWFTLDDERLLGFLTRHPRACILFSNLLGQIPLLISPSRPASDTLKSNQKLLRGLEGRSWASYHDLISSPRVALGATPSRIARDDSIADIGARFFPPASEVTDHETLWLSRETGFETLSGLWEIRPRRRHVIAFVHSK